MIIYTEEDFRKLRKDMLKLITGHNNISCPALQGEIKVGRALFDHIVDKKGRTEQDSYLRLRSIPSALKLLKTINYVQMHKKEFISSEHKNFIDYWTFIGIIDGSCIQILVRQIKGSHKQVYSVVYKGESPEITERNKKSKGLT